MSGFHQADGSERRLDGDTWDMAMTLDDFIAQAVKHRDLWQTTRRLARVDEGAISQANSVVEPVRLLVLLADWCGDAIHTIPVVARLIEGNPQLEMRVINRDDHEALMLSHLTGTSHSIPVVIGYDADGVERGWWGPRPSPLQHWVIADGLQMDSDERYKAIRTWYARDRGETTAAEVMALLRHVVTVREDQ